MINAGIGFDNKIMNLILSHLLKNKNTCTVIKINCRTFTFMNKSIAFFYLIDIKLIDLNQKFYRDLDYLHPLLHLVNVKG